MTQAESVRPRGWLFLPISLAWSLTVFSSIAFTIGLANALRPFASGVDPRVGPAGFGALVVHGILCEDDRRRRIVVRLGFVLELARIGWLIGHGIDFENVALSSGYGFLVAALGDFALHRRWRPLALASLVPIGMACAPFGLIRIVTRLTPRTYDGALLAIDSTLRVPFSAWLGNQFAIRPGILVSSLIVYAALPTAISAGLAYEERNRAKGLRRGIGSNVILAYTVSGIVAAALYVLCPGMGPAPAFTGLFPNHLPSGASVSLTLTRFGPDYPRNAMPSFHVAWAILLARSCAGSRFSLRAFAILFAVATAFTTVGSGEHYVVDVIAAFPFVIALEAATSGSNVNSAAKLRAFLVGTALFSVWVAMIRNAPKSFPILADRPALMWLLVVATISISAAACLRRRDVRIDFDTVRNRGNSLIGPS